MKIWQNSYALCDLVIEFSDILQEKLEWLEQQEKEKAKQVEKDIPVPELATEVMKHEQANKKVISAKKNVYSKKFSKTKAREI